MIDFTQIVSAVAGYLNGTGDIDLVFWTITELGSYLDEAARKLGRTGAFVETAPIDVSPGERSYGLPASTISVIAAYVDAVSLKATPVRMLEALSSAWQDDQEIPRRYALDLLGTQLITIYPAPFQPGSLTLAYHTFPAVNVPHRAPAALGLYFQYSALAAARAREGEGQSQDIAAAANARAGLIEQACRGLWGGAQ